MYRLLRLGLLALYGEQIPSRKVLCCFKEQLSGLDSVFVFQYPSISIDSNRIVKFERKRQERERKEKEETL